MNFHLPTLLTVLFLFLTASTTGQEKTELSIKEPDFLSSVRQLTFEGRRAGEGYFNAAGSLLVFQSERRKDNPFFQIYLLDFETGDVEPVSPGHGKTTCAWIHPDNNHILFSSTHADPEARLKQKQEIEFRESGQTRRYSWDYDEHYEIYAYNRQQKTYQQLTDTQGYDAEGSYSPDGQWITFASNRNAYNQKLPESEQKKFDHDPAYLMDIFIMKSDGSEVRQLTDEPGYDGGPFFSPDGKRICWRRFSVDGLTAEIMTMNVDGSDQKQLTNMRAMSWAPFYHPSGKYLVFTTNKHGFGNFELYLVDVDGKSPPVRVTDTNGFDGLASFSPDGKQLTWTSNRNTSKRSQIYLADWNHQLALKALSVPTSAETEAADTGAQAAVSTTTDFDSLDIARHVDYLCRKQLKGRMTGTRGEKQATAYVAAYLDHLGLKPAGDNDSWFQTFEFPNGAELGPENSLDYSTTSGVGGTQADEDWRPLTFSGNVEIPETEVVFAGYGIVAPEQGEQSAYDSYGGIDVTDKWVLVFRFVPENVSPETRQHLQFYASLRKKAFYARDRGAKGLIVVSGPNSQVRKQLVPLQNDFSPSGSSLAALSVTDALANVWLKDSKHDLQTLQNKLDDGTKILNFPIEGLKISARLDIKKITGQGRNVIGRLQAGDEPAAQAIIVGAHIDHLGQGKSGSSLAKNDEQGQIHRGADDNASGVAGMLEIAEYLAGLQRAGKLKLKRDVIFAAWSGEELGLHGSQHFVDQRIKEKNPFKMGKSFHDFIISLDAQGNTFVNGEPTELAEIEKSLAFIGKNAPDFQILIEADGDVLTKHVERVKEACRKHGANKIFAIVLEKGSSTKIIAALNMDMIGRLQDKLILQGIGSSNDWRPIIESKNAVVGLPLTLSDDTDLPTDASSFYRAGVPILSAFTGSHTDYHTPRDTPEKLNYPETARIARLMGLITRSLAISDKVPDYIRRQSQAKQAVSRGGRAYLGTVPSYGDDVVGVKLSDVTAGAPAEQAGVRGGDIIIGLAGKKIENIYDYTAIIDALKIGQKTTIEVKRGDQTIKFDIIPGSRQ